MFTVDLFRLDAPKFANTYTNSVTGQTSLLEKKITSWSKILWDLRKVPDKVDDKDYSERTSLGSNDSFVATFREALESYDDFYGRPFKWTSSPLSEMDTISPFTNMENKDPSFSQKLLVPNDTNVIFIGDLHSSFFSFINVIDDLVSRDILNDDLTLNSKYHLIFLGDILDRGPYGLDILNIIFQIKNKTFNRVTIINGNHEDISMYSRDGTGDEIKSQLRNQLDMDTVHALLRRLPSVVFLQTNGHSIQCCHGGIHELYNPLKFLQSKYEFEFHGMDSQYGLKNMGLRWSDFKVGANGIGNSSRGTGIKEFGISATNDYLKRNGLLGFIRGHQDMQYFSIVPRSENIDSEYHNLFLNEEDMYSPKSNRPFDGSDRYERVPFHNVFEHFSVLTTSNATKSKDTGYYSYLELKPNSSVISQSQAVIRNIPKVQGLFSSLDAGDELDFLRKFVNGEKMTTSKYDKVDAIRKFLSDNFVVQYELFPLFELLQMEPFKNKKVPSGYISKILNKFGKK